jgi:probable F420-dependent oxidoreductase
MEFGAHLPLDADPASAPLTARDLVDYSSLAEDLGFAFVAANDHILFRSPWLDGPMCLAAVCAGTSRVRLATTSLIPSLRHPAVAAKAMGTLDRLSGGRLLVGVAAGSYAPDFAACGIPFTERFRRMEECVDVMRRLWADELAQSDGPLYPLRDAPMEPKPLQRPGPPVWIGSWGAPAGLRRVTRLGEGWLASAYNTTPERFAATWAQLRELVRQEGRDPDTFGNALVSMLTLVTDNEAEADRLTSELATSLRRDVAALRASLLIGTPRACAETIAAYAAAGVQRIFIWPVRDHASQLHRFAEKVTPLLPA